MSFICKSMFLTSMCVTDIFTTTYSMNRFKKLTGQKFVFGEVAAPAFLLVDCLLVDCS